MTRLAGRTAIVTGGAMVVDGGAYAGRACHKQGDWITQSRPLKMYRPLARMVKLVAFFERKPGLGVEEFQKHWRTRQAPGST